MVDLKTSEVRASRAKLFPLLAVLVALSLALFLAGCGGDDDGGRYNYDNPTNEDTTETEDPEPEVEDEGEDADDDSEGEEEGDAAGAGTGAGDVDAGTEGRTVKLWFTSGEQFAIVDRGEEAAAEASPAALQAVLEELLAGPLGGDEVLLVDEEGEPAAGADADTAAEIQTQIPDSVTVERVTTDSTGTAVVRFSPEFLSDLPGDAADYSDDDKARLNARLGQVTYTLTQFDEVESVKVRAGDERVKVQTIEPEAAAPIDDPADAPPTGGGGGGAKPGAGSGGASLGGSAEAGREDFQKPAKEPAKKPKPSQGGGTSVGGSGLSVRQVQQELARMRYLPKSAVDGVNGYRTKQAVMAFQAWEGLQRDGVVGPQTTAALKAAKRPKPRAGGAARRIEVHNAKGVALLVENGKTKRAIHVSSGKPGYDTPTGTYSVFRKEEMSWSYPYSVWLPWASYFNNGIAFHEYADVPPWPASHGCVRVPSPEAKLVYKFASIGTAVVVY